MRDFKSSLLDAYVRLAAAPFRLLPPRMRDIAAARLSEESAPLIGVPVAGREILFHCPSPLAAYRARTLLTKEPDTIAWIDAFAPGDVLWDVGANVGCYTLYAAARGHRCLAFEPSAANFFLLCKNIALNRLDARATAYSLAFTDQTGLGVLNATSEEIGAALACFGEALDAVPQAGEDFPVAFRQGALGYTMDEFAARFAPPLPDHLKIDVDGIEERILRGAAETLRHPGLKSVLVEVDEGGESTEGAAITALLTAAGFVLTARARSQVAPDSQFKDVRNHIYERRP